MPHVVMSQTLQMHVSLIFLGKCGNTDSLVGAMFHETASELSPLGKYIYI